MLKKLYSMLNSRAGVQDRLSGQHLATINIRGIMIVRLIGFEGGIHIT
jgi:hypothetical protein